MEMYIYFRVVSREFPPTSWKKVCVKAHQSSIIQQFYHFRNFPAKNNSNENGDMKGSTLKLSSYTSVMPSPETNVTFEFFGFWYFPPIFDLFEVTCLVTLFDHKIQVFKTRQNRPFWNWLCKCKQCFGRFSNTVGYSLDLVINFAKRSCS